MLFFQATVAVEILPSLVYSIHTDSNIRSFDKMDFAGSMQDPVLEHLGQSYAHILCSSQTYAGNRSYKSRREAVLKHYGEDSLEIKRADVQWTKTLRTYHTAIGAWAMFHSYQADGVPASQLGPSPDIPARMPLYGIGLLDENELPLMSGEDQYAGPQILQDHSFGSRRVDAGNSTLTGMETGVDKDHVLKQLSQQTSICRGSKARKAAKA